MTDKDQFSDEPFQYQETGNGSVHIIHSGRIIKTLKGNSAIKFIIKVSSADKTSQQLSMAKATGQFKFGNERLGKRSLKR